jgi:hypothetical protein
MKLPLAMVTLAFSGAVFAQSGEFWFSAGESIIWNKNIGTTTVIGGSPSDYSLGDGFRFGFRFDLDTRDRLGYEMSYFYSRSSLMSNIAGETGSTGFGIHTVSGDVLYHFIKRDEQQFRATGVVGGFGRRIE